MRLRCRLGQVQIEVLQSLIKSRFGIDVSLTRKILYKETIGNTVEGVGHFEPLRHYAEVHLLMEPENEEAACSLILSAAKICSAQTGKGLFCLI